MAGVTRRVVLIGLWVAGVARERGRKPVTHTVTIDATSYQPKALTVHAGDTVVWVNKDLIPHTVTDKAGAFDSKVMPAGASWRLTPAKKGVADYACLFHPTMTGTLTVQ